MDKTIMTEFEKMRDKEFYDFSGSEIMDSIRHAEKLLDELFATFKEKGYSSEDFYGGCALCGEANDFALDIIDEAVLKALPDVDKFERDRLTSKLYSQLHQKFEQEEQ